MSRIETQQWGLFDEAQRRADLDKLRERFQSACCIYYRTGGTGNWKWRMSLNTPNQKNIDEIERMGYPTVIGTVAGGPPTRYAVDGWDDIRMRRTV